MEAWLKSLSVLAALSSALLTGCPGDKEAPRRVKRGTEDVTAASSGQGLLKLLVEVHYESRKAKLIMTGVPPKASLTCALNKEPLADCADGLEFPLPTDDGIYTVAAIARQGHQVLAVGETGFQIGAGAQTAGPADSDPNSQYSSDLELALAPDFKVNDRKFTNGTWARTGEPLTFRFRFKETPRCTPEVRCVTDRLDSPFKPLCDSETTKVYHAGTMARGLQYLRVEASCGDRVGQPLLLYWYGVPDNYRYMAVGSTVVDDKTKKQKRYIFNLLKPNDCPANKLRFQCRSGAKAAFKDCPDNFVDNPQPGFAVQPLCNGVTYPVYEIE